MDKPGRELSSVLAVDVGEVNTRAILFDIVEGRYRFLAAGTAPTLSSLPNWHISSAVRKAIDQLEEITGRRFLEQGEHLITPERPDRSGVDAFVVTVSAGPPLKVIAIGLLEDISLQSARNLAQTTYSQVVANLSLNDGLKPEERLDTILSHRPDLIVIAGGSENGSGRSILRLVESVGLACALMTADERPEVIYAGNQRLGGEVIKALEPLTRVYQAANIRPGLENEHLLPALSCVEQACRSVLSRRTPGVMHLINWSAEHVHPTAIAFARIIRFLSKVYDSSKGVLGVDVGASATTIAAAFSGDLTLRVYPQFGIGEQLASFSNVLRLSEIARWLPLEVSEEYLRDYIFNKATHPSSLPVTAEDQAIEAALARCMLRESIAMTARNFPKSLRRTNAGRLSWFEPIIAAGSVITKAPSPGQSLLILLDALQPAGITTLVLDQNNLTPAIGAAGCLNPLLAVQVLESSAFLSLATVISPISNARPGIPILRLKVTYQSGDETSFEVKQGSLETLPLPLGQSARIRLLPFQKTDVGMGGPGRGGSLRVVGGALGVVIDARGRPLRLPADPLRRSDLYKKWLWTLGGK